MSNSNNQTKAERKAQSKLDREKAEADKLRRLSDLEKVAVKQLTGKLMPSSASSTGRQKEKLIKLPEDAMKQGGSVRLYGSPYNALNSQLHKFQPTQTQMALMAWAHTVANPRTQNPHPVPLIVAPGASASVPQVYQCTLYGVARANAVGCVFIGANADGWAEPGIAAGGGDVPTPFNKYLSIPGVFAEGQGFPVHYTGSTYTGSSGQPNLYPNAGSTVAGPGAVAGLNFASLPVGFVTNISVNTRYTCISVELRARPTEAPLDASGELVAFNYRRAPVPENSPSNDQSLGQMLVQPTSYLSRQRCGVANWPSDKWLSTVAVPNTTTCFGQWTPNTSYAADSPALRVGRPSIFVFGEGLAPGAPVEFEVTMNYAIYGAKTFMTTAGASGESVQVDGSRAAPVVANGLTMVVPRYHSGKPDAAGIAAVVRAEQQDGRMPSIGEVVSGVKTAATAFEAVTGTDIGTEIAEIVGGIAALLV